MRTPRCKVEGCTPKDYYGKGYCGYHYRITRYDAAAGGSVKRKPIAEFDGDGNKRCAHCNCWKPVDEFERARNTRASNASYTSYCKLCTSLKLRVSRLGLTLQQYDELFDAQEGRCAICRRPEDITGKSLSIDHDHSCCPGTKACGRCVRGLLCTNCNTGIGMLGDSTDTLLSAFNYLKGRL